MRAPKTAATHTSARASGLGTRGFGVTVTVKPGKDKLSTHDWITAPCWTAHSREILRDEQAPLFWSCFRTRDSEFHIHSLGLCEEDIAEVGVGSPSKSPEESSGFPPCPRNEAMSVLGPSVQSASCCLCPSDVLKPQGRPVELLGGACVGFRLIWEVRVIRSLLDTRVGWTPRVPPSRTPRVRTRRSVPRAWVVVCGSRCFSLTQLSDPCEVASPWPVRSARPLLPSWGPGVELVAVCWEVMVPHALGT